MALYLLPKEKENEESESCWNTVLVVVFNFLRLLIAANSSLHAMFQACESTGLSKEIYFLQRRCCNFLLNNEVGQKARS